MEGEPEGTDETTRRRWWMPIAVAVAVVFVAYLAFRLVQGVLWLLENV